MGAGLIERGAGVLGASARYMAAYSARARLPWSPKQTHSPEDETVMAERGPAASRGYTVSLYETPVLRSTT